MEINLVKTLKFYCLSLEEQQVNKELENLTLNDYYYSDEYIYKKCPILESIPGGEEIKNMYKDVLKETSPIEQLYIKRYNNVMEQLINVTI